MFVNKYIFVVLIYGLVQSSCSNKIAGVYCTEEGYWKSSCFEFKKSKVVHMIGVIDGLTWESYGMYELSENNQIKLLFDENPFVTNDYSLVERVGIKTDSIYLTIIPLDSTVIATQIYGGLTNNFFRSGYYPNRGGAKYSKSIKYEEGSFLLLEPPDRPHSYKTIRIEIDEPGNYQIRYKFQKGLRTTLGGSYSTTCDVIEHTKDILHIKGGNIDSKMKKNFKSNFYLGFEPYFRKLKDENQD